MVEVADVGVGLGDAGPVGAATGFELAQPRLSAKRKTPWAKLRWLVIVLTASPARRLAAM